MAKTSLLLLSLLFSATFAFAQEDQELVDKKGRIILPQQGDYALGISTNSIFNFIGNMFNNTEDNQLALSLLNGQLYGKYFLTTNKAIRGKLRLSYNHMKQLQDIGTQKRTSYEAIVTGGFEKRKGTSRFQFSYGPELSIGTAKLKIENDGFNADSFKIYEETEGFILGGRVFAGFEYFFLPKISIGGEVGFGIQTNLSGRISTKMDNFDNGNSVNNYYLRIGPDIQEGAIVLLVHF